MTSCIPEMSTVEFIRIAKPTGMMATAMSTLANAERVPKKDSVMAISPSSNPAETEQNMRTRLHPTLRWRYLTQMATSRPPTTVPASKMDRISGREPIPLAIVGNKTKNAKITNRKAAQLPGSLRR